MSRRRGWDGESTDDADEAAAKRHDGHAASNALQEDVLDGREREAEVRRKQLEDAEAHEAGGHGHDGHPARLQAKVHVGEADDGADGQPGEDGPDGEAAPRN